jgi:hypothetical protein
MTMSGVQTITTARGSLNLSQSGLQTALLNAIETPGGHRTNADAILAVLLYPELTARVAARALRDADSAELERRRVIIETVTRTAFERLRDSGEYGQCAYLSNEIMVNLETEGIPCFALTGTLEIIPRGATHSAKFSAINPDSPIGHTWVVAPPFLVVDASLACNPFPDEVRAVLPNMVLERSPMAVPPSLEAVFDARWLEENEARPSFSVANRVLGVNLERFWTMFKTFRVSREDVILEYTPVDIVLSEDTQDLEASVAAFTLNGGVLEKTALG